MVLKLLSRVCARINSGEEMCVFPGLAFGNEMIKIHENCSELLLGKWE